MAEVLGISKATVTQYDRVLAENGLRSKSGRGTGAAKINSRDAVNLLIALATSPLFGLSAKDAVRNCATYASLSNAKAPEGLHWSQILKSFGLPTLAGLPKNHSFGQALESLIDASGKGETFKPPQRVRKRYSLNTTFEVRFVGPGPFAEIVADGTKDFGLLARILYAPAAKQSRLRTLTEADLEKSLTCVRLVASVSARSKLLALWSLVRATFSEFPRCRIATKMNAWRHQDSSPNAWE